MTLVSRVVPLLFLVIASGLIAASIATPWWNSQGYSDGDCKFDVFMFWQTYVSPCDTTNNKCTSFGDGLVCVAANALDKTNWRNSNCQLSQNSATCKKLPSLYDGSLAMVCLAALSYAVLLFYYIVFRLLKCGSKEIRRNLAIPLGLAIFGCVTTLIGVIIFAVVMPQIYNEDSTYCLTKQAGCTFYGETTTSNVKRTWGPTTGWILAVISSFFIVVFIGTYMCIPGKGGSSFRKW
eukprot:TRINITY_DN21188_c0_g1_i1.p1 TRINITY_DN21188_c0_g1~~TRINITY_DN21188_c0_g1_i1.p1  ORF type:complete len:236 (-),score=14.64 TRINITY_DN21188_c0_g1_i1:18-725(-)